MHKNLRKIEITSWILVSAVPLLCIWTPLLVVHEMPDNLAGGLILTLVAAAPFVTLSIFMHIKNRNAMNSAETFGLIVSAVTTVICSLLIHLYFWHSMLTSKGFDFTAASVYLLFPVFTLVIIPFAYGIGKSRAKEK